MNQWRNGGEQLLEPEYHAFIVHHHDDEGWVEDVLIPKVEGEWEFSVCYARRDFMAGVPIFENIANAIDVSYKTLLIVTPNFVQSAWCDYEMNMALSKGPNHVVACYLEHVAEQDRSKTLSFLMKSDNYLEYSDNEDRKEVFWKRMKKAFSPAARVD